MTVKLTRRGRCVPTDLEPGDIIMGGDHGNQFPVRIGTQKGHLTKDLIAYSGTRLDNGEPHEALLTDGYLVDFYQEDRFTASSISRLLRTLGWNTRGPIKVSRDGDLGVAVTVNTGLESRDFRVVKQVAQSLREEGYPAKVHPEIPTLYIRY